MQLSGDSSGLLSQGKGLACCTCASGKLAGAGHIQQWRSSLVCQPHSPWTRRRNLLRCWSAYENLTVAALLCADFVAF